MLLPLSRCRGRGCPAALPIRLAALALTAAAAWPAAAGPAAAEPAVADPSAAARPADLVILQRSESVNGTQQVGVFGAKADPRRDGLWSVQVWEQTASRVTIATDRISCSPTAPLRITGSSGRVLVRELNPGGVIHATNRLDHLIWWAVCHPAQAGRDPATLGQEARRLGYSGVLVEQQQVLQSPGL